MTSSKSLTSFVSFSSQGRYIPDTRQVVSSSLAHEPHWDVMFINIISTLKILILSPPPSPPFFFWPGCCLLKASLLGKDGEVERRKTRLLAPDSLGLVWPRSEAQEESGTLREIRAQAKELTAGLVADTAVALRDAPMGSHYPVGKGSVSSKIKARFVDWSCGSQSPLCL